MLFKKPITSAAVVLAWPPFKRAVRRLLGFTDEMLGAVVRVGQFDDPQSEELLVKFSCRSSRREYPSISALVVNVKVAVARRRGPERSPDTRDEIASKRLSWHSR
jgi:hypothetical protein